MSRQDLYRLIISTLKQLRIPFVDPCDANYTGDCICGSNTELTSEFFTGRPVGTVGLTLSTTPAVFHGVYEDGLRLRQGIDFTRAGTNILFTTPTDAEHDYEVVYA